LRQVTFTVAYAAPAALAVLLLLVFLLPNIVMGQGWFVGARHNESPALPLPVLPALLLLVLYISE
jgi:hypothetical protein